MNMDESRMVRLGQSLLMATVGVKLLTAEDQAMGDCIWVGHTNDSQGQRLKKTYYGNE